MPKNKSGIKLPTSPDGDQHIKLATSPVLFESTDEMLQYIKRWMQVLNLRDWELAVSVVPKDEVTEQNGHRIATCEKDPTEMRAVIKLIRPDDYKYLKFCLSEYDMERVLVHEMLHVKYPTEWIEFKDDTLSSRWDDTIEFMIEQTSKSLVELERAYRLELYGESEHGQ